MEGFPALPWASGPLAFILGVTDELFHVPVADAVEAARAAMPPLPDPLPPVARPCTGAAQPVVPAGVPQGRRRVGDRPDAQDVANRQSAVEKWLLVLLAAKDACPLWVTCKGHEGALRKGVEQCLELKAAGTAHKRAGSILLYLQWASKAHAQPFPMHEEVCNQYLEVAVAASATRATSFLEAVAFMTGLFGVHPADDVFTARNRGLAARGAKRKRARVQRTPITAASLQTLEAEVAKGRPASSLSRQEYIVAGHLLFRVHARLRCGDATRITMEPVVDGDFFETVLNPDQHKSGHAQAFRTVVLPVAGFAKGVLGAPWCEMWLAERHEAGLHAEADGTLMPAAMADGSFGQARMSTSELGLWERALLAKLSLPEAALSTFGTHSAKATLLSWAAKADLSPHHRKLLGSHVDREEQSMLTYARDALAGPLQKLGLILEAVRSARFRPDESRSGRWLPVVDTRVRGGLPLPPPAKVSGVTAAGGEGSVNSMPAAPKPDSWEHEGDQDLELDWEAGDRSPALTLTAGAEDAAEEEGDDGVPSAGAPGTLPSSAWSGVSPTSQCAACGLPSEHPLKACSGCGNFFHDDVPCLGPCPACQLAFCAFCRCPETGHHTCLGEALGLGPGSESDAETDRPSDHDEAGEAEEVDATAVAVAATLDLAPVCSTVPAAGLVRHARYRTIHAKDPDARPFKTACGLTFLPDDFEEIVGWPAVAWPLCRRGKCDVELEAART